MSKYKEIQHHFLQHSQVVSDSFNSIAGQLENISEILSTSLNRGGTIIFCGNGGSAADSQHLAAEFVGRFSSDRRALRSISLSTDTSVITCISNDYSYEDVFARQISALARPGDILIAISTSGNSPNIINAVKEANKLNCSTIAFIGKNGGKLKDYAEHSLIVPSDDTARIQEVHILLGHILCNLVEINMGFA